MSDKTAYTILDAVGDLSKCLTWLDIFLCPLADLTMCLGRLAVIREVVAIEVV